MVFLMLAALPMIFVRVSRRRFKIAALMIAAPGGLHRRGAEHRRRDESAGPVPLDRAGGDPAAWSRPSSMRGWAAAAQSYRAVASRETQNALSGLS